MPFDATAVVVFGEGVSTSDQVAVIELDDELNAETVDGVTSVKTSFNPGDEAHFRVQLKSGFEIARWEKTDGTITDLGYQSRTIQRQVFLTGLNETVDLGYYIDRIDEDPYWGNAPNYTLIDSRNIRSDSELPSIFLLSYTVTFRIFKLTPPDMDNFFNTDDNPSYTIRFNDSYPIGIVLYAEPIS